MNPWYKSIKSHFETVKPVVIGRVVEINKKKLSTLAEEWALEDFEVPNWRAEPIFPFDNDDYIQWLGITTAINAHYRAPDSEEKFYTIWRNRKWSGAFGMSACVTRAIEEGVPILKPWYLGGVSTKEMYEIFNRDSILPLLEKRKEIWQSIGCLLFYKYGHFKNLFKSADYRCFNNGNGICERLVRDFPKAFCDEREFNGQILPIHKKALLLPLLYYGRAKDSENLPQIKDIESISPVADYELPKVLWELNIFSYSCELLNKIITFKEIPAGSNEETSIRYATIITVGRLLEKINRFRQKIGMPQINMTHLDYKLWNAGRNSRTPHHITQTLDY